MTEIAIRPAVLADIPAITRIYAHAVLHGTASFELDPPDEAEMTRRMQALLDGGFPYIVAENGRQQSWAMPMPGPIAPGRLTASRSRIRSMSIPTRSGAASAACCSTA